MKRHGSYRAICSYGGAGAAGLAASRYYPRQVSLLWHNTCVTAGRCHRLLSVFLTSLLFLYTLLLLEQRPVIQVAVRQQLSVWSVYLVLRRYELCRARIGLVLFELGCQPADHQRFTARECLEQMKAYGLSKFIHRYWQHNRRYLWQSRFHNRASPPVTMGWHENGRAVSHNP